MILTISVFFLSCSILFLLYVSFSIYIIITKVTLSIWVCLSALSVILAVTFCMAKFVSYFLFLLVLVNFAVNYLQFTGFPRVEYTTKMEVIDSFGQTRLCQGINSMYPNKVSFATATYTNGRILSCGGYNTNRIM